MLTPKNRMTINNRSTGNVDEVVEVVEVREHKLDRGVYVAHCRRDDGSTINVTFDNGSVST
jgi:hypothetical protein